MLIALKATLEGKLKRQQKPNVNTPHTSLVVTRSLFYITYQVVHKLLPTCN